MWRSRCGETLARAGPRGVSNTDSYSAAYYVGRSEAGKPLPAWSDKHGAMIVWAKAPLSPKIPHHPGDICSQWNDPQFAPFSSKHYLLRTFQTQVSSVNSDGFRDARSSTDKEEKKRIVSASAGHLPIRPIKESFQLALAQVSGHW